MGKIVVVGSANVGVEVPPFQPPKLGAVVDGPPFDFGVGGSALNTATVAARLGASVSFLGMVGDDLGGNLIYEHFQREGVDVSRIQRLEGRPSPSELVFFGQNGERGIVRHAGTNIDFRLPENAFRVPCRMAHFSGIELIPAIWPLKAIEMVRQFRVAGQKVSFTIAPGHPDASYVERHVEEYRRFADLIDTVIATEGELQMITGRDDWEGMMKYFHERGVEHVAVNQGKEGAVIWSRDGGLESVKAPRVRFVDIDGAGESFAAGFLAGIAKGFTPKDAGRMACTAAGLCVRARGALEGTKDPELVERAFKDIETSRQAALA